MKVNFIFRKKNTAYSIEGVFESIIGALPPIVEVEKTYLPNSRVNLRNIFQNIIFAYKSRSKISHITGDIHYIALALGRNTVLTVHDINSILRGNIIKKLFFKIFWFYIPAFIVSKITVISEFSKNELVKVIPFAKKKIRVIHNPYSTALECTVKPFNVGKPKILHIGTGKNKNLIRVCQALCNINCQLIIVGKLNDLQLSALSVNNIDYINKFNLSFDEIKRLYAECDVVSFPSLYEGFGMPIIEGQAVGRVVLTSNIQPMIEVAGDGACLVNPLSVNSITEGFKKIIENKDYRESLISQGIKNIDRFRPERIANEYLDIYRQILTH